MKRFSRVLIILLLVAATCASMQKHYLAAFQSIAKALVKANHEVAVISVNGSSDFIKYAVFPNFRDQNVPHSVMKFENLNSPEYKGINTSAVIAFDSIDSLQDFNNETYTCRKPKFGDVTTLKSDYFYPFQFFVYCPGMTEIDLLTLKDNKPPFDSFMLRYEYFILDEGDFIKLWTFVWYTPEKCNQMQLLLVNQFSKKTQTWEKENFVIEKFGNFHGCTLNFSFNHEYPSYVRGDLIKSNKNCLGYLCETAKVLSRKMNYSYISHTDSNLESEMDLEWDTLSLAIATQALAKLGHYYFFSNSFNFREIFIVIPKGEDVDSYERIVRPFDTETWIWVAITFIAAFATIFVVKFMSVHIQDTIIGRDTATPAMNVLRIFFGISQIKCPDQNFARFLVMSFILFCIVIRTAYQAKMFDFLQKDLKKPTLETVDELIDNNFTFHMRNNFTFFYNDTDFVKRATIVEAWDSQKDVLLSIGIVQEPGNKVAMEMDLNQKLQLASQLNTSIEAKILDERMLFESDVLFFPAHHKLYDSFNKKFKQMFEAGLFDFYIRELHETEMRKIRQEPEEPFKILTLEELEAGFVVSLVPLLLSVVVFCFEWIVTLKDLLIVWCLFNGYFKIKSIEMNRILKSTDYKARIMEAWQKHAVDQQTDVICKHTHDQERVSATRMDSTLSLNPCTDNEDDDDVDSVIDAWQMMATCSI